MAETMHNTEMNQRKSASQQMAELQPLLSSQSTSDSSSPHLQQPHMEDEAITIDIKALTEISEEGFSSPFSCIYKVPTMIRLQNKEAYTPKIVSIGPFHHGDVRLQGMERHKGIMFKRFAQNAMTNLDTLIDFAKQNESKVRASYFETINCDKKDLVKLILVDSAFIIQLFIMKYTDHMKHDAICDDLLLLENQLPFFFLEGLYNIAFRHGVLPSFLELTYCYFDYLNMQNLEPDHKIEHFTDLLRLFYLPITQPGRDSFNEDGSDMLRHSANELQKVGLKLKATTSKCLLDLEFSGSVLQIPLIKVEAKTEFLFRNVMALEQCHYPSETYFCDYMLVLDNLVNTNEDVEVLARVRVINNLLSDVKEVATLFNGLGKNITFRNFNEKHLDISLRLNKFCEDPWRKKMAILMATLNREDHTSWRTMASIAAFILLFLTVIQTICSILQVL